MPVLDIFAEIAGVVSALVAGPMGQMLKFAATLAKYLLPVYGLYKGILALQSANVAISRVAAIIEAGRLTTLQGQVVARGEENAISKITIFFARLRLLFAKQELETQVLTSAQKAAQLGLGGKILVMLGFQNAVAGYQLAKEEQMNTFRAIGVALEETILGSIIAQGVGIVKNIGKLSLQNFYQKISLGLNNAIAALKLRQLATSIKEIAVQTILTAKSKLTFLVDIGRFVANAAISLFKINPILGIVGGLAATAAGFALYNKFKGDDVVSGGYGKRTLLAPEGAIQLNDKDTVIAGTDLGGGTSSQSGGGTSSQSGGGSVNMAPLVAELQAIKTLLNTVLTKEGTININGTTVATAIYPDIQRMSRLKDFKTQ